MNGINFILCVKGDTPLTPYRFWEWEIMTKEKMDILNDKGGKKWHPYYGSPSLIPFEVNKEIEIFEKRIGYAIQRTSCFGDTRVLVGKCRSK